MTITDKPVYRLRELCRSKVRFPAPEAAQRNADRVHVKKGWLLKPYFCSHCHGWHLTSRTDET